MADWDIAYGLAPGTLPVGSSEEALAAWFLLECNVWPYKEPFFNLPPEKGKRIRELLERHVPHRLHVQFRMLEELKKWGGGSQ